MIRTVFVIFIALVVVLGARKLIFFKKEKKITKYSKNMLNILRFFYFFRWFFFHFIADFSSRILGGRNVFLGELPYQVSLRYWGTTNHFAGGVLLNTRWILTTAHGVFIHPGNGIDIILGIIRVDTGESLRSSEIRVHPLFDRILLLNE